jgi:hypothetical protein
MPSVSRALVHVLSRRAMSSKPRFSPLAAKAAEDVSSNWKGTTASGGKTKNYIGGKFTDSKAEKWLEVKDPVSMSICAYEAKCQVDANDREPCSRNDGSRIQCCC